MKKASVIAPLIYPVMIPELNALVPNNIKVPRGTSKGIDIIMSTAVTAKTLSDALNASSGLPLRAECNSTLRHPAIVPANIAAKNPKKK